MECINGWIGLDKSNEAEKLIHILKGQNYKEQMKFEKGAVSKCLK